MRALSWTLTALALPPAQENRNPEALGGVAPVGNGARWSIPANTKDSHHLPVPYSIAATDVENGHRTAALGSVAQFHLQRTPGHGTHHHLVRLAAGGV